MEFEDAAAEMASLGVDSRYAEEEGSEEVPLAKDAPMRRAETVEVVSAMAQKVASMESRSAVGSRGSKLSTESSLLRLLDEDPRSFFLRFGHCLSKTELSSLAACWEGDAVIEGHVARLKQLKKVVVESKLSQSAAGPQARNRRYRRLHELLAERGEDAYFSDVSMQERDPGLFYDLLGRHMGQEDPALRPPGEDCVSVSGQILEALNFLHVCGLGGAVPGPDTASVGTTVGTEAAATAAVATEAMAAAPGVGASTPGGARSDGGVTEADDARGYGGSRSGGGGGGEVRGGDAGGRSQDGSGGGGGDVRNGACKLNGGWHGSTYACGTNAGNAGRAATGEAEKRQDGDVGMEEKDGEEEEDEEKEPAAAEGPNPALIEQERMTLVQAMAERFLRGADADFVDYTEIDAAARLDDLDQEGVDAQDCWFDHD